MRIHHVFVLALVTAAFLPSRVANAYPVGPAVPLEELVKKADIVFKAVVVSSKPADDDWFEKVLGFSSQTTEFKVLAVYKGANLKQVSFHHYAMKEDGGHVYSPQHYEFSVGTTYLVFAAKTDDENVFRQIWKNHTSQEDQGVLLAADQSLHPNRAIKEIVWRELAGLLKSDNPDRVQYAIEHLNRMSDGAKWGDTDDFSRDEVLKSLLPLLAHGNVAIAGHAVRALGTNNPMMDQGAAAGWLATVGKGHIPGYGTWDRTKGNPGGVRYWKELSAIADSKADTQVRSLAIRSLGLAKVPEIRALALRWIQDPQPLVVQSAVVLLSDYLRDDDHELLEKLSMDPREQVRIGVATAIGYGQVDTLIPALGRLVNDSNELVSAAAALSLLSFSLDNSEKVLKANRTHANFGPLFVNALAQKYGLDYVDELCEIIRNNRLPQNWWGGFVVWGDSWNVLFNAAQSASKAELSDTRYESVLNALEAPASGDPKAPTYYGSSEPRDLYALYLQKGLSERAKAFRDQCKKTITYDIDYFFKEVDRNPGLYKRDRR